MTYEIKFELTVPDEVGRREALVSVIDALYAMAEREGMGWKVGAVVGGQEMERR